MARSLDQYVFRFIWRIENFSMCPQKKGEWICSPAFVVHALSKTMWYLMLDPKGDINSNNYISCKLCRMNRESEPERANISFFISPVQNVHSFDACFINNTFEKSSKYGLLLINLDDLYYSENRNTLLPNDVFSVLCFMTWPTLTSDESSRDVSIPFPFDEIPFFLEEFYTVVSEDSSYKQMLNQQMYTTRINVERSVIRWIVTDFKTQIQTGKRIFDVIQSKMRNVSIHLQCYLSGVWDSQSSVCIDVRRMDEEFIQMLLKCKVSTVDKNGTAQECFEGQHVFGENYEIWSLPLDLKVHTIEKVESGLLNAGALTLRCEFKISYLEVPVPSNSASLVKDIRDLHMDSKVADVAFIADGSALPAHKSIIFARSPKFRTLFSSDTEEKRTGIVQLSDVDADTLNNMKSFMYGNDLRRDLEPSQVMKLYEAAHKYEFVVLKQWCAASLKYRLSVPNACCVLMLALSHKDDKLFKYVLDFFSFHRRAIFKTDHWKDLVKRHKPLVEKIIRKLCSTSTNSQLSINSDDSNIKEQS